ncbi:GTPase [Arenimonas caeni]|jgi:signal recognition particle receptor subunit beta|uniref:GTP-binding protein n=1 Tax=Arenimonas caeni TaxID=2058085 RepID=UPI002A36C2A9|nr:GTPase [Arenimonas caeni]MDY0021354.1 GTPase [Arenimonas caeni]
MASYANKLVFVGGMGAGKSTAIAAISDLPPVSTDMPLSADATADKTLTTVALDYSTVDLGDGELLHLYGVPGQKYLDFMWPMVCDGAVGIVVLVNACEPEPVATTCELLRCFSALAPQASFVVGVTRTDQNQGFLPTAFRDALGRGGFRVPVVRVDAREQAQVEFLIRTLIAYRHAGALVQEALAS